MKRLESILSELNTSRSLKIEGNTGDISSLTDVHNFIIENNITEGKTSIPIKYVYGLYCEQNRVPIKMNTFSYLFSKFFTKKHTGLGNYFHLGAAPFNLPEGYSFFKEYYKKKKYKYENTRYKNIQSTPEGWMVYLNINKKRHIFTFVQGEKQAAKLADKVALFYYGKDYDNLNFKDSKKSFNHEDPSLLTIFTGSDFHDSRKEDKETGI